MAAAFAKSATTIPPLPITPQIQRTLPSGRTTDAELAVPKKSSPANIVYNARPNTTNYPPQNHGLQKLTFPRIPAIVNRLSRETHSSSGKRWRWYRSDDYVDFRNYTWRNLPLYTDYKAHLWTGVGTVRKSFPK